MSFDKDTRNLLLKTVTACRRRLTEDVTDQLRGVFGLHPDGTVLALQDLSHLSPDQAAAARRLRDLLDHYAAGAADREKDRRKSAYERMTLEISFTILNRLAALRLCEERGLVVECVRKEKASDGFRLFERVSGGALGGRHDAYRVFLECLFDELALDLGILFDRMTPQSSFFPSERCLEDVLGELNKPELNQLWMEDETIGWIYQYFNPPEERKALRDASQAPRDSRELAVRNQFFTPRYVVEFLSDNTLGRIWYEMHKSDTALKEECRYLVRWPNEVFLPKDEKAPSKPEDLTDLSQEELLKKPVHIEYRPKKDPRDLHVLDPACGSGHFLLYTFDLLEQIYEEAWSDPESTRSEATGRTLQEDFETLDHLRREVPKLIIEHNLHGIDIDPRAVQIAALALWLRAQRTWKYLGIKAVDRPRVAKSNIVTAEPMPGEEDMKKDFTSGLKPRILGQFVDEVFDKMKLAGEAGSLLKIEEEIKDVVSKAKDEYRKELRLQKEEAGYLPGMAPKRAPTLFDFADMSDEDFLDQSEDAILAALKEYAERAENGHTIRRRLFADDAARGFSFIDLCRKHYDVVLMNPPFGGIVGTVSNYIASIYPATKNDIYAAFIERGLNLLFEHGMVGAITSRTGFFLSSLESFRSLITRTSMLRCMADLGQGVLDSAMVKTASYVLEKRKNVDFPATYFLLLNSDDKNSTLLQALDSFGNSEITYFASLKNFSSLPGTPFAYWAPKRFQELARSCTPLEADGREVRQGLASSNDFRFIRAWWEIPATGVGRDKRWVPFAKGGESIAYYADVHLLIDWKDEGASIKSLAASKWGSASRTIKSTDRYFSRGITYTSYTNLGFHPRALPEGCIFSVAGMHIHCPSENLWYVLGILSSRVTKAFLSLITDGRKFEAGYVKRIPYPDVIYKQAKGDILTISDLSKTACQSTRLLSSYQETVHDFSSPSLYVDSSQSIEDACVQRAHALQTAFVSLRHVSDELDELVCQLYDVKPKEIADCLAISTNGIDDGQSEKEDVETWKEYGFSSTTVSQLVSWLVGVCFGRWDIRFAIDPSLIPKLLAPFAPLPICPPGMLVGPNGLPAESNSIVGEKWLRARPDVNTLPLVDAINNPIIPDSEYPIRIAWNGILVDDPGFNGTQPHRDDIVRRIREVLDFLWKDKAHEIEQEACDILGVSDLRDYFRKPAKFFQEHLKRYSKSRRKAPIYWPLSTTSGFYTIWIYYHRLTDQTLYAAVNKYVEPKISEVERGLGHIEDDLKAASGREATRLRDQLHEAQAFLSELRDLREELLRIAALPYKPNLNDGVIINAAPLTDLFNLRSWANDTKKVGDKLKKGEYDWAHLAYTIWPDRVRDICKKDRSIAITHGLEYLCEVESLASKKKSGRSRRGKEAAR